MSASAAHVRVDALLAEMRLTLEAGQVADARSEARDIIAALLNASRFWPTANLDAPVDAEAAHRARRAAQRRARGEPFAYAVGRAAFRHLTLAVDHRVLIPRQETEMLVEVMLEQLGDEPGGVAVDVGTGSGAIALALAHESTLDRIIATDVSADALAVAEANYATLRPQLRRPVEFRSGALLGPVRDLRVRAVISNPPYIAFEESTALPPSVRDWEPPLALYAADDGMAATDALIAGAADILECGGVLGLELDARRAARAVARAAADGRYRDIRMTPDLAGRDRVLTARRTSHQR